MSGSIEALGSVGQEVPFCQSEWQGITFSSLGVNLSLTDLPTPDFYTAFYSRLVETYGTYRNLPADWLRSKTNTSRELSACIELDSTVLSFGCGIGFVEWVLARERPDLKIFCHDFAGVPGSWPIADLENVEFGWVPAQSGEQRSKLFNVIYLCQVLYAVPYGEAIDLLTTLANQLVDGGMLILVDSSVLPEENGQDDQEHSALAPVLAKFVKKSYRKLFGASRIQDPQFWGWQRDNQRYQAIIEEAGLESIDVFAAAGQSFHLTRNRIATNSSGLPPGRG